MNSVSEDHGNVLLNRYDHYVGSHMVGTMMAPTHMLVGAVVAVPLFVFAPEYSLIALVAGLFGGLFPDLDMYYGHRRTLHFPVYYSLGAGVFLPIAALVPTQLTVGCAVAVSAAALHSTMDIFGGGLELYPWRATSDRAVFSHYHDRWIVPRRWIRYDGSPADLGVTLLAGGILLVTSTDAYHVIVLAIISIAVVYVALRKMLPRVAIHLVQRLPIGMYAYLPSRYLADQ